MPRGLPRLLALAALAVGCKGADRQPSAPSASRDAAAPAAPVPPPAAPAAPPSAAPAGPAPAAPVAPAAPKPGCARERFAASADLAEASAALYAADPKPDLVVVSDSGNRGAFVVLDPTTGDELGKGALPLDSLASDDHEGLSKRGDRYVVLTSSGFARHYRRVALDRFELDVASYPIAPPGSTDDLVCRSGKRSNCGRNWEGLCLFDPPPATGCAGFAASKRDGELVCLTWENDRLRADPSRTIDVTSREALADCTAIGDTILAGANAFGASRVFRITGAADPASAVVESLGPLGSGFPEAIAAGPDGAVYRFSDLANRPSLMDRFTCR